MMQARRQWAEQDEAFQALAPFATLEDAEDAYYAEEAAAELAAERAAERFWEERGALGPTEEEETRMAGYNLCG